MNTNKKTARMAGLLYLIYIVVHVFADAIGRWFVNFCVKVQAGNDSFLKCIDRMTA